MKLAVEQKDLIGKIKDFPIEVVQKMCENQVAQGNEFNPKVFQEVSQSGLKAGGFDWCETKDGDYFWFKVICQQDFNLFFEKYPKEMKQPKQVANENSIYPKVMWVGNSEKHVQEKLFKKVVFMEKNKKFFAWSFGETIEESEESNHLNIWDLAKDLDEDEINPPVEMTIEQIEKELGKKIKIIN